MNAKNASALDADRALIQALGGPTRLARLLGYGPHGVQRVHNWTARGIPSAVKLERPDLFLADLSERVTACGSERRLG